MKPVWRWFHLDLGRRWRSIAVIAILIAVASGTVMTALSGARRGATAVGRLTAETLPATVVALPNEPGFDWNRIRALPEVDALTGFAVSDYRVDEVPPDDWVQAFPPTDSETFDTIERPVVLEGRTLDPTRDDEVVVTPRFLSHYGMKVGDTVHLRLYSTDQVDSAVLGQPSVTADGPVIEATIVGAIRSPWFSEQPGDPRGAIVPSPAVFANYPQNILGIDSDAGYVNALIRLHNGEADIPRFKDDLARVTGRSDIDVWDLDDQFAQLGAVTGFEAAALAIFAIVATVAAVFIVGQTVVRHVTSTRSDLEPLHAAGMTPRQTHAAVTLGPAIAGVIGSAAGDVGAVIASRWFPIGSASGFEPAPGMSIDFVVLGLGVLATLVLVIGGSLLVSAMQERHRTSTFVRRSTVATAAVRAGMPVPTVVGARFALEPGRGRTAIPVRPAIIGVTIGVLGVVAAFIVSNGIADATTNPQRYGITYEGIAFAGYNGNDFGDTKAIAAQVAADPDVDAVNDTPMDVAQVDDVAASLFAIDTVGHPIDIVVTEGRLPANGDEVALAPTTAKLAGISPGDKVPVTGSLGTRDMTVSGFAFVPSSPHNDYDSGGWVTADGYHALFDGHKFHFVIVDIDDAADVAAVEARIAELGMPLDPPELPGQLGELQQIRVMPLFLAGFLVVLALGAVGHALVTTVRRRSHDVAVLRAVGMSRRQTRLTVITQATTLGLVGLVVGIPLGMALGRTVWRYVAERTPLLYIGPASFIILATVVPIVLIAVILLALAPSRRAARMHIAQVLRTE